MPGSVCLASVAGSTRPSWAPRQWVHAWRRPPARGRSPRSCRCWSRSRLNTDRGFLLYFSYSLTKTGMKIQIQFDTCGLFRISDPDPFLFFAGFSVRIWWDLILNKKLKRVERQVISVSSFLEACIWIRKSWIRIRGEINWSFSPDLQLTL